MKMNSTKLIILSLFFTIATATDRVVITNYSGTDSMFFSDEEYEASILLDSLFHAKA